MLSVRGAACGSDPAWQPTIAAYTAADTDNQLRNYYQGWQANPKRPFTNTLAKSFGSGPTGYMCGIGLQGSCGSQIGCDAYVDNNDPAWSYLSLLSIANLDTTFNDMYTGITNGQLQYISKMSNMSQEFFPKYNLMNPSEVMKWIQFTVAILPLFGIAVPALAPAVIAMESFAQGGLGVANTFMPVPADTTALTMTALQTFVGDVSKKAQDAIVTWANTTFWGYEDDMQHTILDYAAGGGWVDVTSIPSATVFDEFYFRHMVASTVNSQWNNSKIFTIFQQTGDPGSTGCANETMWYSPEHGGVHCTYLYTESGTLSGYLDKPYGLDVLMNETYGISGVDITKSSAKAYRLAGFNFTEDDAWSALSNAMSSPNSTSPFLEGPGWTGTFTLPVCDIGIQNWTTAFGDTSAGRFGMLPCCCGPNCTETAAFVEAANMKGFQTLLRGCKRQYGGFEAVDYGFGWRNTLSFKWAMWGVGKRIGFVVSSIATLGVAVPVWLFKVAE
ncbi:hypothetical protein GE09DRAFT_1295358 [Coniochaeta sp. 2T2.1]|nr:hypothetical protein GE09DRAFT_1295358 [Coniochaeta sp. 2T2.1]